MAAELEKMAELLHNRGASRDLVDKISDTAMQARLEGFETVEDPSVKTHSVKENSGITVFKSPYSNNRH